METRELLNRIEYIVSCVGAFVQQYKLSNSLAYGYLRRYSGIGLLIDCYATEHTLSIEDAVSDLQVLCYKKGGKIG